MKIGSNLKKLLAYVVVLLFIVGLLPIKAIKAATEELTTKTIQILATTDLHGRFVPYDYARATKSDGGLTQIATLVNSERQNNPNTILVDNGDNIQGNYNHLFLNDEKNPMMTAMNYIGYDSFGLGNHEFNFGMRTLKDITGQLQNTEVLCANLYKDNARVFSPYVLKTVEDGIKVAIIGVVTPHIDRWDGPNLAGYIPTNPTEEVKKVIGEIKAIGGADVYVVTAHMGFESEYGKGDSAKEIAKGNPDVDVVVMGHSHMENKGLEAGNAILIQPANNAGSLGKVELKLTKKDGKYEITSKTGSLISTKGVEEDTKLVDILKSYD
ncbi:metallophosphoesterase, partial [Clostridium nigeriense]